MKVLIMIDMSEEHYEKLNSVAVITENIRGIQTVYPFAFVKPLPEKYCISDHKEATPEDMYFMGYNKCIDEITGE